jgi:hypothetical protein
LKLTIEKFEIGGQVKEKSKSNSKPKSRPWIQRKYSKFMYYCNWDQKFIVLQVWLNSKKTFDHRKFQVCSIALHMDIYSHDLHINNTPRISLEKLCWFLSSHWFLQGTTINVWCRNLPKPNLCFAILVLL